MKKIVFCVTNDLTYDRRMIRIAETLANSDFEVLLVGRNLPASQAIFTRKFSQHRLTCRFHRGLLFYLEFNLRLFFFLLKTPHHITGSVDSDTLLAAGMASVLKRTTLSFDAHEYFTEVPELAGKTLKKMIWRSIEHLFIRRAKIVYTVSASIADIYSLKFNKEVALIRNVPFKSLLPPAGKQTERIIIYQGALNLGRGLEELVSAMEKVPATLWIVGEGDHSESLRKLVESLPYQKRIHFLGYVAPDELTQITRKASIGYNVLKALGESYRLSLSNKFFDYMQQGVPSLSSPFPEYERILKEHPVGKTCHCNPTAIASALNDMLDNEIEYNHMVKECERAAEEFHWQHEEKKLIQLYHGL